MGKYLYVAQRAGPQADRFLLKTIYLRLWFGIVLSCTCGNSYSSAKNSILVIIKSVRHVDVLGRKRYRQKLLVLKVWMQNVCVCLYLYTVHEKLFKTVVGNLNMVLATECR